MASRWTIPLNCSFQCVTISNPGLSLRSIPRFQDSFFETKSDTNKDMKVENKVLSLIRHNVVSSKFHFSPPCIYIITFAVRLLNDTEIAKAKRDFELKKAAYDVEVQTKVILVSNVFHI